MEISEAIKIVEKTKTPILCPNYLHALCILISLAEKFEAIKGFPEHIKCCKLGGKCGEEMVCSQCHRNKAIDDCKLAVGLFTMP